MYDSVNMARIGCVLGHSFVSSIADHIATRHHGINNPKLVARELKLNGLLKELHLIGERGACVMHQHFQAPIDLCCHIRPHFVLLQYGSNDLAKGCLPLEVATKVVDIAHVILDACPSVKHVKILSVINRTGNLLLPEGVTFSSQCYDFNKRMKDYCEVEMKISYQVLKGFWQDEVDKWSRDVSLWAAGYCIVAITLWRSFEGSTTKISKSVYQIV